jgi:phosphatidylcholine synthase
MAAAVVIVFASALYFADTRMKTPDRSFSGFPAAWNMLAIVVFVARPPSTLLLVVVLLLTGTMFLPVKFIHPVRTARWRPLSLPVAVGWTALAGWAALADFVLPGAAVVALVGTSVYLAVAGAVQQLVPVRVPAAVPG